MKSKEQKQKEAIVRARTMHAAQADYWRKCQPGQEQYIITTKFHNKDVAEKQRHDADNRFLRHQVEAQVDAHGNPLTKDQVDALKARLFPTKRVNQVVKSNRHYNDGDCVIV